MIKIGDEVAIMVDSLMKDAREGHIPGEVRLNGNKLEDAISMIKPVSSKGATWIVEGSDWPYLFLTYKRNVNEKLTIHPIYVRSREDDFNKGDTVFSVIPLDREEYPVFVDEMKSIAEARIPLMVERAGKNGLVACGDYNYKKEWLSFFSEDWNKFIRWDREGQKEKEEPVSFEYALEKAKKKSRKHSESINYEPVGTEKRCAFSIFIVDPENNKLKTISRVPDICHSSLGLNTRARFLSVVDYLDIHLQRDNKLLPFFASKEQRQDAAIPLINYWMNSSPFSKVIKTKTISEALEEGIEYDTSFNISAVACAAIGLRTFFEFPEKLHAFDKLSKIFSEHVAAIVSLCLYWDAEEGFYIGFQGWHDLISKEHDAAALYKGWTTGDLKVFHLGGVSAMSENHGVYKVYEHLSPLTDRTSKNMLHSLRFEEKEYTFVSFEDLVEALNTTTFIKEIVNG